MGKTKEKRIFLEIREVLFMIYALPYILFVLSFFAFQYLPKAIGRTERYYYPWIYIVFSLLIFLGCRGFVLL